MGGIRLPFFFLAAFALALAVAFEISALAFLPHASGDSAPGLGAPYLALIDGVILYSIAWMTLSLLPKRGVTARVQNIVTILVSLLGLIGTVLLILAAFGLLMLMIGLLLAPPFGTIAYFAIYADFPKTAALSALSFVMFLKLFFLFMLFLAHQGFLKNTGLMIMVGLSLFATWLTSLLIALPPGIFSSITDAVAALFTGVIAAVRLMIIFVGALLALRPPRLTVGSAER